MSGSPKEREIKDALGALFLDPSQPKDKYEFWETQPVAQFSEDINPEVCGCFQSIDRLRVG